MASGLRYYVIDFNMLIFFYSLMSCMQTPVAGLRGTARLMGR